MKNIFILLLILIGPWNRLSAQETLDNTFYVFNNCVRTLPGAPDELDDQIALIKDLGYDGMGGHHSQDNLVLLDALNKAGLQMPEVYWPVTLLDSGEVSFDQRLLEIIRKAAHTELLVTLVLSTESKIDDRESGDQLFAAGIAEIADYAIQYDAKIAVYPHVGNYCETVDQTLRMATMINRDNAGMVFNLCHFLKVEGEKDWKTQLKKALPYVYMVSLNGTDSGDTQAMDWDRLIQPLGEGTFDTFEVVRFLKDQDYGEKYGLQCYNIKQDCEIALKKSMATWKDYQKRVD